MMIDNIRLPIKIQRIPTYVTNFVIIGDLIRETISHEVALKISETCYLPVRSFGLEQFLHAPKVTIDKQTIILVFTSVIQPRRESLLIYAKVIGTEVIEINEDTSGFNRIPKEFVWLAQLLYGQYLALELSRQLRTNPDSVRADQTPYRKARNLVRLQHQTSTSLADMTKIITDKSKASIVNGSDPNVVAKMDLKIAKTENKMEILCRR